MPHNSACLLQTVGTAIAYVETHASKDVMQKVVENVYTYITRSFRPSPVFVYGASGAGKTRMGWHMYQALSRASDAEMLVGYTFLQPHRHPLDVDSQDVELDKARREALAARKDNVVQKLKAAGADGAKDRVTAAAARALAKALLSNNQRQELQRGPLSKQPYSALLLQWGTAVRLQAKQENAADLPVCLIVHIDEFQKSAWETANMVRAIIKANDKNYSEGVIAVPVLTGLSTTETDKFLTGEFVTGTKSRSVQLHYFDPRSDAAKQVAVNSFKSVGTGLELTSRDIGNDPLLLMLFEDIGGWTLGLVRFGGTLAMHAKDQGCRPADVNMANLENSLDTSIAEDYESSGTDLEKGLGLGSSGWPKLLLLLMAPFKVRHSCCAPVHVSVCVCVCVCVGVRLTKCSCIL